MRMSLSSFNRRPSQPVKTLSIGDRAATVIAIAAQKGGVGKTTTAVSLACAWARFHGLRVLLIDLDPQANCALALRAGLGEGGGSLAEVLSEGKGKEVAEIAIDSGVPGLDLTPDDPELQQVEARLAGKIGKELALRHAIERSRTHYDLIVLDCPPHLGPLSVNALAAADQVVAVLQILHVRNLDVTHEVRLDLADDDNRLKHSRVVAYPGRAEGQHNSAVFVMHADPTVCASNSGVALLVRDGFERLDLHANCQDISSFLRRNGASNLHNRQRQAVPNGAGPLLIPREQRVCAALGRLMLAVQL